MDEVIKSINLVGMATGQPRTTRDSPHTADEPMIPTEAEGEGEKEKGCWKRMNLFIQTAGAGVTVAVGSGGDGVCVYVIEV